MSDTTALWALVDAALGIGDYAMPAARRKRATRARGWLVADASGRYLACYASARVTRVAEPYRAQRMSRRAAKRAAAALGGTAQRIA